MMEDVGDWRLEPDEYPEWVCVVCGEAFCAENVEEVGYRTETPLKNGRRQPSDVNWIVCWICDEEDA